MTNYTKKLKNKSQVLALLLSWWNNRDNFEHISDFLSNLPLRQAKGLFAFYKGMRADRSKVIDKMTDKEKYLYELH